MNATMEINSTHADRMRQAHASATAAAPSAVQMVIAPVLAECDLALWLPQDIEQETPCYFAGDILFVNAAIEPIDGDQVVVMFKGGALQVVDYPAYLLRMVAGDVHLRGVLFGYYRPLSLVESN